MSTAAVGRIEQLTTASLPPRLIEMMRPEDRKALKLQTRAELEAAYDAAGEREMQRTVGNWLRQRGYWPRPGAFLDGSGKPERGWYIHLNETKRNPCLLDLMVIGLDGRCVEIEMKTATGRVRPEQAAILAAGGSVLLCRWAAEAIDGVVAWERTKGGGE